MATLRVISISIATAILLCATAAFAEYNDTKLRQVAGGYLDAVHVVAQLQQSRCAGYFTTQTDSFADALGDIAGYLSPTEVNELESYLKSDEYRKAQATTRGFIDGWIQSLADIHGEEPIACKTVTASVAMIYDDAKQNWNRAKAIYGH